MATIAHYDPNINKGKELFDSYEVCHTYLLY